MTKKYAEGIYASLTCKLTEDCYVIKAGAHLLTIKQLTIILAVWEECVIKEKE